MTRRKRRTIFYLLVLLFIITGAGIIFYAQGWRIDLRTFRPEKVGAIFVRSFPVDARITLNGAAVQNTAGFLSRGTFISELSSGSYRLSLAADGYDTWQETVSVSPSLVTELKYAVLVPQNAAPVATGTVSAFFVGGNDIVAQDTDGTIMWRGASVGRGTIVGHSANLKNMIVENAAGVYTLYDFTNQAPVSLNAVLARSGAMLGATTTMLVDPYDPTAVIADTGAKVLVLNLQNNVGVQIAAAPAGGVIAPSIASSPSFIAWAQDGSSTSTIVIYDKFAKTIAATSTVQGTVEEVKWIDSGTLGVLLSTGALYRYSISSRTFSALADDVKDFYPTPDGTMLAALEHRSIEVFSFTTDDYYRFNLPDMASVQSLAWYKDQDHLFVQYPDHTAFLDFVDQGLRNVITVSDGTASFYDPAANSLYLIDQGQKLIRFDFPS